MSSPRRLIGPERDVQRLRVSFNVATSWRELERKACGRVSIRDQAGVTKPAGVAEWRPGSIKDAPWRHRWSVSASSVDLDIEAISAAGELWTSEARLAAWQSSSIRSVDHIGAS